MIRSDDTLSMRPILRTVILGMLVGLIAGVAHAQQAVVAARARPRPRAAGPSIASAPIVSSARGTSRSNWATRSSLPTRANSSPTRTGRSRPVTSSSHRPTAALPPIAPSSTPRRSWARSTTPGAWRRSANRKHGAPRYLPSRSAGSSARCRPCHTSQGLTGDTDVIFFGETIEKVGPRNTRSRMAVSRPACSPRLAGSSIRRTVVLNLDEYTAAAERGVPGEGRADVLHPVPVLPDQTGGSRDRHPVADLRVDLAPRSVDSQRLFLGHRPQRRRHRHARLVFGRPRRVSGASIATISGPAPTATSALLARPEPVDR